MAVPLKRIRGRPAISWSPIRCLRLGRSRRPAGFGVMSMKDGLPAPAARGLPVPVRERRPALAWLAVLLILGGALATALLIIRADQRVSAILVTKPIGAGRPFEPGSIRESLV